MARKNNKRKSRMYAQATSVDAGTFSVEISGGYSLNSPYQVTVQKLLDLAGLDRTKVDAIKITSVILPPGGNIFSNTAGADTSNQVNFVDGGVYRNLSTTRPAKVKPPVTCPAGRWQSASIHEITIGTGNALTMPATATSNNSVLAYLVTHNATSTIIRCAFRAVGAGENTQYESAASGIGLPASAQQ